MKIRKILVILTIFSLNIFTFNSITNASSWSININYSNYDWNQSLQISWSIDAKIDELLSKKFEDNDYYNQFRLLKDLSSKVVSLSNKSSSKKDLFTELANYLSLKSDLLYKVSKIENTSDIKEVKNIFKTSIKTKWTTLNKVIDKVNASWKLEITNENTNFDTLSKEDFEKEVKKIIDNVKVNKYKSYAEILTESKNIQTSDDFKKIKDFLPDTLKFIDEFWNDIKWWLKIDEWFISSNYYFTNANFNAKVNSVLWKLDNLKKEDLTSLNIAWLDYLYDIFEDDDLIYNFLIKIKVNEQISKEVTLNKKVDEIYSNSGIVWYGIFTWNKSLLTYWNKFDFNPRIDVLLNKSWNYDIYLNMVLKDYIYIWNNESWEKQYLIFDWINRKLSFAQAWISWISWADIIKDTNSNINIVFEDWKTLNNKTSQFSLEDFKEIISKKIVRINIDWEDVNSWLLIQKWSILNIYK